MDLMASGLSFRAISEFIKSDNLQGLKIFLDTRHVNIEDKDEVRVPSFLIFPNPLLPSPRCETSPMLLICKLELLVSSFG